MATGNTNFATLAATTLQNFANEIFDNVVTNNALLSQIRKGGNIKIVGGGRQFTMPVFFQENNTFGAVGKFGTIPTTFQDNLTRAAYDIKIIAGSIVISQVEEAMNAGDKEKLIDYVEEKKMEAEISMGEKLGDQLFNTAVGADDIDSVPRLVANAPTADTDVGGIPSTANAYWRNQTDTSAITAFGTAQAGTGAMDRLLTLCTFGKQGPTMIVTTKAIWSLYQTALTANVRYLKLDSGDAGFKNLLYADLPVFFDDNVPASRMYFIDTNSIKFQVLSKGNMAMTAFEQSHQQLVTSSLLYIFCNLTAGQRRTSGVLTNITG